MIPEILTLDASNLALDAGPLPLWLQLSIAAACVLAAVVSFT
jgi:hypothetical protein